MMAPWQVWTIPGRDRRHVLIISSDFHLRANVGRMATIVPLTGDHAPLDYRVPVQHPREPVTYFAVTDRINTIHTVFEPTGWTLTDAEVVAVKQALKHMIAL